MHTCPSAERSACLNVETKPRIIQFTPKVVLHFLMFSIGTQK